MIDDKDIWRVAKLLVKAHGGNAEAVAAQHVDERLSEGDLVGRDIWRQVLAAVQELQREKPREGERANWRMVRVGATTLLGLGLLASPALADDPIRPDPRLTPGAVLTTDAAVVCAPGYGRSVRHTPGWIETFVYREYGIDRGQGCYEVDHLIPLGIGGANVSANLWPESYDTQPWNAAVKNQLDDFLHDEVCAGRIPITQAQKDIAEDWIAAYRKYIGPEPRVPAQRPNDLN